MSKIRELLENCRMDESDIEFILFEGTNADRRVKQKKIDPKQDRRQKVVSVQKNFRLPQPLVTWLERAAKQKGIDQTQCVEQALRLWAVFFGAERPPGIDWGEEEVESSFHEVLKDLPNADQSLEGRMLERHKGERKKAG